MSDTLGKITIKLILEKEGSILMELHSTTGDAIGMRLQPEDAIKISSRLVNLATQSMADAQRAIGLEAQVKRE